jgi:branched-subunit amino acid transport protein
MKTSLDLKPVSTPSAPRPATAFRWRRLLPLFTLVPAIGLILSGLITWFNIGWTDDFGARWMRAFFTALPVMPLGIFTMLALDRVLSPRLAAWPRVGAKVVLALCTTFVMELMMASVVTYSNSGLGAGFAAQWVVAFVKSLPVGVLIGLAMSFLIKPRLDRWMEAT